MAGSGLGASSPARTFSKKARRGNKYMSQVKQYYRKYVVTLLIPQAINAVTVILWITLLIQQAINAVNVDPLPNGISTYR